MSHDDYVLFFLNTIHNDNPNPWQNLSEVPAEFAKDNKAQIFAQVMMQELPNVKFTGDTVERTFPRALNILLDDINYEYTGVFSETKAIFEMVRGAILWWCI